MANVAGLDAFNEIHETEVADTSKKVKIAIIGTGWIAESHAEAYNKMEDVEVVGLADWIEGKADRFKERYGLSLAKTYRSHQEMLDDEENPYFATATLPCRFEKTQG